MQQSQYLGYFDGLPAIQIILLGYRTYYWGIGHNYWGIGQYYWGIGHIIIGVSDKILIMREPINNLI